MTRLTRGREWSRPLPYSSGCEDVFDAPSGVEGVVAPSTTMYFFAQPARKMGLELVATQAYGTQADLSLR